MAYRIGVYAQLEMRILVGVKAGYHIKYWLVHVHAYYRTIPHPTTTKQTPMSDPDLVTPNSHDLEKLLESK